MTGAAQTNHGIFLLLTNLLGQFTATFFVEWRHRYTNHAAVIGWVAGFAWVAYGWPATVLVVTVLAATAWVIAARIDPSAATSSTR